MDLGHTSPACPGLINAFRLRPGQAPEPLDGAATLAALAEGEGGLWLHMDLVDQRGREVIARLPLPPLARQALLEPDEAPHLEVLAGAICGAVPDFLYDVPEETGLLHLALTPELLVTARRHPLRVAHATTHAPAGGTPSEVLAMLLRGIATAMGQTLQQLAGRLSQLEDGFLKGGGTQDDRQALAGMRRAALRLDRVFAPVAETLAEWAEEPYDSLTEPFCAPVLREERRFAAARRGLAALQEHARIAQDELAGLAAEETNRRLFVLSVISAAMLPASLVAGIFGMNVGSVPGVEQDWGFLMAMGVILASILGILGALRFWMLL